jgi:hemoglobin
MSKSLFGRLGGRQGVSVIVDDIVENYMNNTAINTRLLPFKYNHKHVTMIKNHTIDFFITGSGGPNVDTGKDMVTTHTGINISSVEYMHTVDDIFIGLDKSAIDTDTKKDVLSILWSLKEMIISK